MSESLFEIACFEAGWSRRGSVDNDLQIVSLGPG